MLLVIAFSLLAKILWDKEFEYVPMKTMIIRVGKTTGVIFNIAQVTQFSIRFPDSTFMFCNWWLWSTRIKIYNAYPLFVVYQ